MSDENYYKREEDQKWRDQVTGRLVSLTNGEQVQNGRLDKLEASTLRLDLILRGDPDGGLIESIDQLEAQLRRINAVLEPDALGKGGLVNEVRALIRKDEKEERRADRWWKGIVPVVVAIVSLIGLLLTNLERIEPYFKKPVPKPLSEVKKKQKRRVVVRHTEAPRGMPEVQDPDEGTLE